MAELGAARTDSRLCGASRRSTGCDGVSGWTKGALVRREMRRAASARAAKDLRCCSVFGAARNATPYPRSTYQADVAATAFRRGRGLPDAAARRGCRRVAFDRGGGMPRHR